MKIRPEDGRPVYTTRQPTEAVPRVPSIDQLIKQIQVKLDRGNFTHQELVEIKEQIGFIAQAVQTALTLNEES
jgi:hypothetical protein